MSDLLRERLTELSEGLEAATAALDPDQMHAIRSFSHQLRALQRQLLDQEALLMSLAANLPDGTIAFFDHQLCYTMAERTGLGLASPAAHEILGKNIDQVFAGAALEQLRQNHLAVFEGRSNSLVCELNNQTVIVQTSPTGFEGRSSGLLVLKDAHQVQVQQQVNTLSDGLTNLGNRRAFEMDLTGELSRAARHSYPLALLALNLGGIKALHDRFGHQRGGQCLQLFASTLRQHFRAGDRAYRLEDDLFVLLLPHAHVTGQNSMLSHVRGAIAEVRKAGFDGLRANPGIAFYPEQSNNADQLFDLACQGMQLVADQYSATSRRH